MNKHYTLKEIADFADLEFIGNPDKVIESVSDLDNIKDNSLVFLFEEKYLKTIELDICVLIKKDWIDKFSGNLLLSDNPKADMAKILSLFETEYEKFYDYQNVFIGENVKIGKNVSLSPFVYIGKNVVIDDNTTIMSGAFIGENSIIGSDTKIYPNVSIMSDSIIGNKVIIHSNTVIGSDGYGFIQNSKNEHFKIPQVGNVVIEDNVEIGSNVSIDRGTIGSTIIKSGTKIDNMVHIAHNVKVGERTLIIAQSGIAGSSEIGNDVILAGQVGVGGHISIGDKSIVMSRSGVTKSHPENSKLSGFPARKHTDDFKEKALIKKIPELLRQIDALKEILELRKNEF